MRAVDVGRPGRDLALQRREDEGRGAADAVLGDREVGRAVEHDARRVGARGQRHHQRLHDAVAVVQRRRAGAGVGDPREALRVEREAPGVDEVGVVVQRVGGGGVAHQRIGHVVAAAGAAERGAGRGRARPGAVDVGGAGLSAAAGRRRRRGGHAAAAVAAAAGGEQRAGGDDEGEWQRAGDR